MAGHVVVFAIVGVLGWVMKLLLIGVVGADDEVLHMFHAWPFEPKERKRQPSAADCNCAIPVKAKQAEYTSDVASTLLLRGRRRVGSGDLGRSSLGVIRQDEIHADLVVI